MSDQPADAVDQEARGIVVTHGSMCFGMVDAVKHIAGTAADALTPVSNDGKGPDELLSAVSDLAEAGPTVIFTDLQTGSCALAARFACKNPEGRRVVCGTNLAMLLDFVFHRHLPLDELETRLVQRGRDAIRPFHPGEASGEHRSDPSG